MLNSFFDKFIFTNSLAYKHNNFFLANMPFLVFPTDVLVELAKKEDSKLNLELYYSVKAAVKNSLRRDFKLDFGVEGEKGLVFMETFLTASGWGKLERKEFEPKKFYALVNVSNSIIAAEVGKSKMPVDTFLRGFLAGIYSIYFGKEVECVEVACISLGSNSCDFLIKPLEDFNFENVFTRKQLKVE